VTDVVIDKPRRKERAVVEFIVKVSLLEYPAVWRRLSVPAELDLGTMHRLLLVSLGWMGGHLHQFENDKYRFADSDAVDDLVGDREDLEAHPERYLLSREQPWLLSQLGTLDEECFTVADLFATSDTAGYVYDFGDNWKLTLQVERRLKNRQHWRMAILDGKLSGPPEDCGGTQGFAQVLAAFGANVPPVLDWNGEPYDDADLFDRENTKTSVRKWVKETSPEYTPKWFTAKRGDALLVDAMRRGWPLPVHEGDCYPGCHCECSWEDGCHCDLDDE